MKVWALASGSSGNCFLVESEGTRLLVECGRSMRDVLRYLAFARVAPEQLDGILITHAHGDHIRSARQISDRFQVPVFASGGTLGRSTLRHSPLARAIESDHPFSLGTIEVHPFAVPHDCAEPLGFRLESHSARIAITTDLGWAPDSVRARFPGLDLLVLEANYDPYLLHAGRYPPHLKSRVAGYRGHLANQEAAEAIADCGDRAPLRVWLAHLSENNNTPREALATVGRILRQRGLGHVPIATAKHRKPSLAWDSAATPARQLALF